MLKLSDDTYKTNKEVLPYLKDHPGVEIVGYVGKYTTSEWRHMKGLSLGPRGRPKGKRVEHTCPACGTTF